MAICSEHTFCCTLKSFTVRIKTFALCSHLSAKQLVQQSAHTSCAQILHIIHEVTLRDLHNAANVAGAARLGSSGRYSCNAATEQRPRSNLTSLQQPPGGSGHPGTFVYGHTAECLDTLLPGYASRPNPSPNKRIRFQVKPAGNAAPASSCRVLTFDGARGCQSVDAPDSQYSVHDDCDAAVCATRVIPADNDLGSAGARDHRGSRSER
jgi:hypothetical protein